MTKINWNKYSYSEEKLREEVLKNISARSTMIALGLSASGAGYKPFKRIISLLKIDTSHWLGQAYLRNKNHQYQEARPLNDILKNDTDYQSYKLKNRLIKENLLDYFCQKCHITEWNNSKLNLHLDHINGNNRDNRIENLRLLCPNCHSQTETYCGKNKKKKL